jgi:hypothetical protein
MTPFEAMNILFANRQKNFAQRALYPQNNPKLDNGFLQDPSTHSMGWGTDEKGKAWAYPTVVQQQPGGWLQRLNSMKAWGHAERTGERIPFNTHQQADEFSKGYKAIWPQKPGKRYVPFYQR